MGLAINIIEGHGLSNKEYHEPRSKGDDAAQICNSFSRKRYFCTCMYVHQ